MTNEPEGLSTTEHIVALGDELTRFADELHARIVKELREHKGDGPGEVQQAALRALFDDELVLRQRANGLYADAAAHTVNALGQSQRQVAALTAAAATRIGRIALIQDTTSLVAGVLQLAGAASAGQPALIIQALDRVRHRLEALGAHAASKPA